MYKCPKNSIPRIKHVWGILKWFYIYIVATPLKFDLLRKVVPFAFSHKNEFLLFRDSSPLAVSVDAPFKAPQLPHRGGARGVGDSVHSTTGAGHSLFFSLHLVAAA